MARVFLSYDRDDEPRARAIAAAIERAGHAVWWDRRIKAGGEFSAEIEAELNAADKVVVLWSDRAVRSAWVRDEAAVGRETGRLVPATLDGTPAPLGFRQFQTIDLSKHRRGANSAALRPLLDAIAAERTQVVADSKVSRSPLQLRRSTLIGAAAVVALVLAGVVLVWLWRGTGEASVARVLIAPADASQASQHVASELTLGLGSLSDATASEYQIVDPANVRSSQPDLTLSAAAGIANGRERRELTLRSVDGDILWSTSIEQPSSAATNLSQQVSVQAQRALSCAAEALAYRRERIRADTLKLYVSGCTSYDAAYGANADESRQINLLQSVIAKAPHFTPAWAKLLMTEIDQLQSVDDVPALRRVLAQQVKQAQTLGLDFGELYAAKSDTFPAIDFLDVFRAYDEGIRQHPDNANLYLARGERELYVGRMLQAVSDSARAAQLDPLSPGKAQALISAYAYSGNIQAAYAQLRKSEQLWPQSPALVDVRYRLDVRFGDPKEAAALLGEPQLQGALQAEQAAFIQARIDPSPQNVERSIEEDEKVYRQYPTFIGQIVQTLAQFGRDDELFKILMNYTGTADDKGASAEVLFRPAMRSFWREPRSMAAAAHHGLLHYWKASGKWPDFCADPTLPYDCRNEARKYSA